MKIKRISGILIGTSAILVSAVALTSCGGESISFKSYKTESTKEEFEKAYDSFIEEKKTTGYDLTVGNASEQTQKNDDYEVSNIVSETHIETYDSITSILYTYDDVDNTSKTPISSATEKGKVEKIYQTNEGLNTIINLTNGTYTSLSYNASAAKTRSSSIYFDKFVNYYSLVNTSNEAYSAKYYNDESVYTVVVSYDLSKDESKETKNDDVTIKKEDASYELTLQFYGIDSEYFIGYKKEEKYTVSTTSGSKTVKSKVVDNKSSFARLYSVPQSIELFDLTKYKKDYIGYAE